LPKATKQVLWRIALFYIISLTMVGLMVPHDNLQLLGNSGSKDDASPFVIAIRTAGVRGLPSVFNAVITISVISVANSCTYASTRTMQALCANNMGPKFLAYVDQRGRPLFALVISIAFGFIAYIGCSTHTDSKGVATSTTVFNWLLSLSGLANFFTWGSINLAHIRFRKAWAYNGHTVEELPFASAFGIWGSYIGLALNILCLIAQFYVAVWPIGGYSSASAAANGFFQSYLAVPVVLVSYLFWKLYKRQWSPWVRIADMDVDSGRRQFDFGPVLEQERIERAQWSAPKKFWDWLC